ncbi:MAG: hypothetical protein IPP90_06510 [Gemmatimonadaceae bacterium]|nr:hypothetical protein [Gemmatimonadaceae bacterium]
MNIRLSLTLGVLAMAFTLQPRRTSRPLDDIAVIELPANIKDKLNTDVQMGRRTFGFASTYFWASMGSITRYKQLLLVSVMAPDATDAEYSETPRQLNLLYEQRKVVQSTTLGSGTLRITEGLYGLGVDRVAAYEYVYTDKMRRLQLAWHAVKKEVDLATGTAQIARIAASFRIVRDPVAAFAEMRDAPRKDAEGRAGKVATAKAMLRREGYPTVEPGKPVLRNAVYLEWMSDPEPRYQLLVPLGRVRAAANGSVVNRPRPARAGDATSPPMAGSIGWREVDDGDWRFSNLENDYLPLPGIGAALTAQQQDRGFVYFYYVATVRVEEESDDRRLTSLKWFLDGVPEVQRRWRAGTLVTPGTPEKD